MRPSVAARTLAGLLVGFSLAFASVLQWPGDRSVLSSAPLLDGGPYAAPPLSYCGIGATPIHEIQGGGLSSPWAGATVTVEAVVVGAFQGADQLGGFFLQDPVGSGDSATSDGLFVFAPGVEVVHPNEVIRVTGTVQEFGGLTELTEVTRVVFCARAEPIVPIAVELPVVTLDDWERFEGMLVSFPQELTVTDHHDLARFGVVVVSADGRLFQTTNDQGGSPELNIRRRLVIDDGSPRRNPATIPYLGPEDTLRVGDTVTGLTGVLSEGFGDYRLQPTIPPLFARSNERSAAPVDLSRDLRVASFNVLNYFTTVGGTQARGAHSAVEFTRQRDKIIAAIIALDADVLGLIEIENNAVAIVDLVDGLNVASAPGTYAAITDPGEGTGTDAIKVAMIYRPARVSPTGLATSDPDPLFERPPMAQTFTVAGQGFSLIINHLKSKRCTGAVGADEDQGDGQGCYNHRRTLQADRLLTFTNAVRADKGDAVLVMGDLNSYGLEDPIGVLQAGALINQVAAYVPLEQRYSYVFDEHSGYLDHALSTSAMDPVIAAVQIWHINADEPEALDYNDDYRDPGESADNVNPSYLYRPDAYRSSDHDPVVVDLRFP